VTTVTVRQILRRDRSLGCVFPIYHAVDWNALAIDQVLGCENIISVIKLGGRRGGKAKQFGNLHLYCTVRLVSYRFLDFPDFFLSGCFYL